MGTVVKMSKQVSVSEKGKALCGLEAERAELYARSRRITAEQQQLMKQATDAITHLGREQEEILLKMTALDEAIAKIVYA